MRIGIPKEIKTREYRVSLTPNSVKVLLEHKHEVVIENNAGLGIGFSNTDYRDAGAQIVDTAEHVFDAAEMIVKVKEPLKSEIGLLKRDQVLFTYLHLAADLEQTKGLIDSGCVAIAYETVTDACGKLPLLAPMSEIAGRMSVQVGAQCLEKANGGKGVLIGGATGVAPANGVILGGGVAGTNAAKMAFGLGGSVTIFDKSRDRLEELNLLFDGKIETVYSTELSVEKAVGSADLVIGAVLIPGASAPKLITSEMIRQMESGSVVVDIAIDQGGCFETSKPTNHDAPTYVVDGVVHYCVTNMPGAVPKTSTVALNNATLPFILDIANNGCAKALENDEGLMGGLNIFCGKITVKAVADLFGFKYTNPKNILT